MNHPADLLYTASHEWVRLQGDEATIGITDHAQHELGDVVYLDLPPIGRVVESGSPFGTVESVKAVSDLYAPVSGEVTAVNEALLDAPQGVNESPYDAGWMVRIRLADAGQVTALLDADAYTAGLAG